MDAWALTDHGNGNGLAHAHSAAKKLQKKGVKYRQLHGVEFYFVPSLAQWKLDYEAHKQSIKDAKTAAEAEKKAKVRTDVDADEVAEEEEAGGHVVEDEAETKSDDYKEKPDWQRRYHLVAVAQNSEGLANINRLVKASFKDGFYRYPRIDFDLLRKYGKGIVWSSACLGGALSGTILRGLAHGKTTDQIISDLENLTDRFVDAVGRDSFFLELQFNKLEKQHDVNKHLILLSRKTGLKLVATADSHYPDPSKWAARELYKKLGWMGTKLDQGSLPKFEDLKCELYPKNASQMWEEYLASYEKYDFYRGTEEEVRDAIERTHDIAWQHCEDTWVDVKAKLPRFGTPEKSAMKQLMELLKESMIEQGLADNEIYVSRLKEELEVVKAKQFEDYFLTLYKIFQQSSKRCLAGPARGSGSGSLINYLLKITHVDPVKYDLLFSRFINMGRKGFPDVDCLFASHLVVTPHGHKRLSDLQHGDEIYDAHREIRRVTGVIKRKSSPVDIMLDIYVKSRTGIFGVIVADSMHRLLLCDQSEVYVRDINIGDKLMSSDDAGYVEVVSIDLHDDQQVEIVDISVDQTSTFWVVPFDVIQFQKNNEKILSSIYTYGIDTDFDTRTDIDVHTSFFDGDS